MDPKRMRSCKCHDCDRDSCSVHVDGGTERNGNRIDLLVESQIFAKLKVYGNVSCRASGEECGDTAVFQTFENQRIRVSAYADESNERIDHECGNQHASNKQKHQFSVIGEDCNSAGGNSIVHQTHNTKGSKIDDPADRLRNSIGNVVQEVLRCFGCALHGDTEDHRPEQDAQIISVGNSAHRVGNQTLEQRGENVTKRLGGTFLYCRAQLRKCYREDLTGNNSNKRNCFPIFSLD